MHKHDAQIANPDSRTLARYISLDYPRVYWQLTDSLPYIARAFLFENIHNQAINEIFQYCSKNAFRRSFQPVKDRVVASPNKAALEQIAKRYDEKYDIQIHIVPTSELAHCVRTIATQVKAPTFVGFIVAKDDYIMDGHVASMLGAFVPEKKPQFILMDALIANFPSHPFYHVPQAIPEELYDKELFVRAPGGRQADGFSCRIGAITLLRNALLSLKDQENQGSAISYWDEVFKNASTKLPAEWTYVEQIQLSSQEERSHAIAIRDKFSKKEAKRQNPRSAQDHIIATSEKVALCILCDATSDFDVQSLQSIQPPEGASFEFYAPTIEGTTLVPWEVIVKIEIPKSVNTYLLRKGQKERIRAELHFP